MKSSKIQDNDMESIEQSRLLATKNPPERKILCIEKSIKSGRKDKSIFLI